VVGSGIDAIEVAGLERLVLDHGISLNDVELLGGRVTMR